MKQYKNRIVIAILGMILLVSAFVGCGSSGKNQEEEGTLTAISESVGAVIISVNPEIEIEYDQNGNVLELEGLNDDGKNLIEEFSNIQGEECTALIVELVKNIYEAGYLEGLIEGNPRNIVIRLEEGSSSPYDEFLKELEEAVREFLKGKGLSSNILSIREEDCEENGFISLEKAKELLLKQLGLKEAYFLNYKYKLNDAVYEFVLKAFGKTYYYEVSAITGKIVKGDFENNSDWKDIDKTVTDKNSTHSKLENDKIITDKDKPEDQESVYDENGQSDYSGGSGNQSSGGNHNVKPETGGNHNTGNTSNKTDYGDSDYGNSDYGNSDYGNSDYQNSGNNTTVKPETGGNSNSGSGSNKTDYNGSDYKDSNYEDSEYDESENSDYADSKYDDYDTSDYDTSDYDTSDYDTADSEYDV